MQQVRGGEDLAASASYAPSQLSGLRVWWHQARSRQPCDPAWEVLSPGERDRAERFLDAEARDSFVAGRWIVRTLLGHWLRREPATLPIAIDPRGRPYLGLPSTGWHFSITHAGGLVAVAFTSGGRVGIDLESEPRALPVLEEVLDRVLADSERASLDRLAPEARGERLMRLWTMKEAVLKALGTGLGLEPSEVEIDLTPVAVPILAGPHSGDPGDWTLEWWRPLPGFMGALAWRRAGDVPTRATATLPRSG